MTDYLFLKISEMALRAIRSPKGPTWVCHLIDESGGDTYFDQLPFFTRDIEGLIVAFFAKGTRCYWYDLDEKCTNHFDKNIQIAGTKLIYL